MQLYYIISEGMETFSINTLGYNVLIPNCNLLFNTIIFIHRTGMNCTICGCW